MNFPEEYKKIRNRSEEICRPLKTEDYVVQPVVDVSPPKWHLGHTTWFFETFILKPLMNGYEEFDASYNYVFNSYYETIGARVIRTNRGNLSRPTVEDIYRYRKHVDAAMQKFLCSGSSATCSALLLLGFQHEQQHQELLATDIKYILGHNPLFPAYSMEAEFEYPVSLESGYTIMKEGIYEIGYKGDGFCFDNELDVHKVYLNDFEISNVLVTNGEYLEFMQAGGYDNFRYWHAEGWDWVKNCCTRCPMYWHFTDDHWVYYTLQGLKDIDLEATLAHINYYEAYAYAAWKQMRLPTEFEWEAASVHFKWGGRWEWTESAYLPYPGFKTAPGAIGEYNGKFMVNQKVLRGGSCVTPAGHSRNTYRNFFHPYLQWQYTGIRLVK